jgi:hypothetical protein
MFNRVAVVVRAIAKFWNLEPGTSTWVAGRSQRRATNSWIQTLWSAPTRWSFLFTPALVVEMNRCYSATSLKKKAVTSHSRSKFGITGTPTVDASGFEFRACDLFVICDLSFGALHDGSFRSSSVTQRPLARVQSTTCSRNSPPTTQNLRI